MASKGSWRAGFERVSNFRMYYRDWRPSGGESYPPVLALHGSLIQSGMWVSTAEGVAKARFICPDQRGFGMSEDPGKGDASTDFAQDAVELAAALMLERFTVMGHSFAASIALRVAAAVPERVASVVLVDPSFVNAARKSRVMNAARERPYRFENLEEAVRFFRRGEEGEWPRRHLVRFLRDTMIWESDAGPIRVPFTKERLLRLRSFQASEAGDYEPLRLAGGVKAPALVFRGGKSMRFSSAVEHELRALLSKGSKFVLCPKTGHFPTVSEPGLFHRELGAFLAKTK